MRWRWWRREKSTRGLYRHPNGEVMLIVAGPVPEGWVRVKKGEKR